VWAVRSLATIPEGNLPCVRGYTRPARPARPRLRALPTPARGQQEAPVEMPATGPARLLAHPGLIAHITKLCRAGCPRL
jgi:hypothetical protein